MQFSVKQYDEEGKARAYRRWDSIAKPLKGMGLFEDMVAQIEGMPGFGLLLSGGSTRPCGFGVPDDPSEL